MIAKNSKIFQLLAFLSVLFAFRCPRSEAGRGVAFLILARAERRRWLVLREFAKYAFFGLTRQNPVFERSVLKYVSIKTRILTPSGPKRRVCVNALDRLLPPEQRTNFLCIFQLFPSRPYSLNSSPLQLLVSTATPRLSAFRCPRSKAGRGVTFLILARAKRWRWLVLREFAKYAFFWPDKEKSCF